MIRDSYVKQYETHDRDFTGEMVLTWNEMVMNPEWHENQEER